MGVDIGPRIGIDGEKEFRQQLSNINQVLRTLSSEMKAVTSEFEDNEASQESLAKQADVLTRQIQAQEKKLAQLTQGYEQAAGVLGDTDTKTLRWAQSVQDATADLNKLRGQLQKVETGMDDLGNAAEDSAGAFNGFENIGQTLVAGFTVQAAVDGIHALSNAVLGIVEDTQEYRSIMGTLETSSQAAGYTAEQTAEAYGKLQSVIGESQGAAEATAQFQTLNLTQEQLTLATDATIGAWAKLGQSAPVETIAESVAQTIAAGEATGVFSDLLLQAGVSEDEFNAKLAAASDQTERTNYSFAGAGQSRSG